MRIRDHCLHKLAFPLAAELNLHKFLIIKIIMITYLSN